MATRKWNRDELLLAFNLYCKIPFGQIHIRNPKVTSLAKILRRTPSAVSWKLANFASLDNSLKQRNIKGAAHVAKADIDIWNEFQGNWDQLSYESEQLLSKLGGQASPEAPEDFPIGLSRLAQVKVRINQSFFRAAVLSAYEYTCCISGLKIPSLLIASHIVPWAHNTSCRTNPRNGLCLSAIHDRAFDCGLITVTPDHTIKASSKLKSKPTHSLRTMLLQYEGQKIMLPRKFVPDQEFLRFHSEQVFQP